MTKVTKPVLQETFIESLEVIEKPLKVVNWAFNYALLSTNLNYHELHLWFNVCRQIKWLSLFHDWLHDPVIHCVNIIVHIHVHIYVAR